MIDFINGFYKTMVKTFETIEASDKAGAELSVNEATNAAFSIVKKVHSANGKILMVGNGGSASIASHISADIWKNGGIKSICFNDPSLLTCLSNDLGYEHVFSAPVTMFAENKDVLIAISSSGKSPNIINACKAAQNAGCKIITLSGFKPDNPLRKMGDVNFYVPSDGYGYVEIVHSGICHALVDCVIESNGGRKIMEEKFLG